MVELEVQSGPRVAPTTGDLTTAYEGSDRMSKRICSVPDCTKPSRAKDYCTGHYQRWRRTGSLGPGPIAERRKRGLAKEEVLEQFTPIRGESECWEWEGSVDGYGYGMLVVEGILWKAHRLAYEMRKGSIPDGMLVRHKCDNRPCVNPNHLEVGTHADNSQDMVDRNRSTRGNRHGMVKVSDCQVNQIREAYATGKFRQRELAIQFGCSVPLVSMIVNGKHRGAITDPGAAS